MAKRYMHVPHELVTAIADHVSGMMWPDPEPDDEDEPDDEQPELTAGQAAAIRKLAEALPKQLPKQLRKQFEALLPDDEGDDPTGGIVIPA